VTQEIPSKKARLPCVSVAHSTDPARVRRADLEACAPLLKAAQNRLDALECDGHAGFLSLDWEGWRAGECVEVAGQLARLADTMLLLGIGGSALGGRAIRAALGAGAAVGRRLEILDTVDPAVVHRCLEGLDPSRVVVVAVSKSGSTLETLALLHICIRWLQDALGESWATRVVVVTDAERGGLRKLAEEQGLKSLPIPRDVGGRYSVLTAVGLLPAAFLGVDVDALRAGADAQKTEVLRQDLGTNPAWQMAAVHHCWRGHLSNTVLLSYSDDLLDFGLWVRQLVAESLAKIGAAGERSGWNPDVARGPADQHSQLQLWRDGPCDELFTVLYVEEFEADRPLPAFAGSEALQGDWLQGSSLGELLDASRRGMTASLLESGAPVMELRLQRLDAATLGALFVLFETTVALIGLMQDINPFDQPAVEDAKAYSAGLLGHSDCAEAGRNAEKLLVEPDP